MVKPCRCSVTPWHWSQSPRTAPKSQRLPNAPHWWWESPQPSLPGDTPPDPRGEHTTNVTQQRYLIPPKELSQTSLSSYLRALLPRRELTSPIIPFHTLLTFLPCFPFVTKYRSYVNLTVLDNFFKISMQNPLQHFFTLVPSLVLLLSTEKTHKCSCWEKEKQHNSKIQNTGKQHFATLVSDHVFLSQGKNNPQDAFIAIRCLQLLLITTELLGETRR